MELVGGAAETVGFFPRSPSDSLCSQVENLWALLLMTLCKEPAGTPKHMWTRGKREGCQHHLMSGLRDGGVAGNRAWPDCTRSLEAEPKSLLCSQPEWSCMSPQLCTQLQHRGPRVSAPEGLTYHRRTCSVLSDSVTQRTVTLQAPLSTGFSWREHWSGLSCPLPGDLPDPGIKPASLTSPALSGRFFTM